MSSATLRYPSNIDGKNVPYIIFTPYQYKIPLPSVPMFDSENTRPNGKNPTIAMYMPGDFTENVNATWGPENIIQGGNGASLIGTALSNLTNYVNGIDGGKLVASTMAWGGAMPYPTDVNIFRGAEPMSFTLNFNMIPNNDTEATHMVKIVQAFKKAILPNTMSAGDKTANGGKGDFLNKLTKNVLLKFPEVWDIHINKMNGLGLFGVESDKVTYQNMCLTNCSVNYSSGTEGAAVYSDGNPIGIKMSLSFTSLRKHYIDDPEGNTK